MIVAGVVAVAAVATGGKDDTKADATPTAVTSLTAAPAPTSAAATPSPTLSPSPTATSPSPTASPTRTVSQAPTTSPTPPPATAPTSPSQSPSATATPTKTTGQAKGPHVASLAITDFTCTNGKRRTATAKVYVMYDGTAEGTLHLTWWRSATGSPQGAVDLRPQTAHFPKGAQSYSFNDQFTFTTDPKHPYIGLTVSSDPAASSGNNTFRAGCH
ncbi:hypothetical protein ABZ901_30235 [Actinacidiphila alni]|uniref:hypothetical protein n=1 Tax=Actinacidiphila alni TaxID=380248 RepID=UPI00340BF490